MMRPSYLVGFAGVDDRDQQVVRTMLDSASSHLQARWNIAEKERADVVVCGIGHRASMAGGRVIARMVDETNLTNDPRILPTPIRLMPFIELLRYAENLLAGRSRASSTDNAPRVEAAAVGASVPAPGQNPWLDLANAIRGRSEGILKIAVPGRGPLLIDLATRTYVTDLALIELRAQNVTIEFDPRAPAGQARPAELANGRKLEELLWIVGLRMGNGQLAPWLNAESRFRLQHWPNFTTLPYSLVQMRIASHFGNFRSTPADVANTLRINIALVNDVVNAFSLMGLLQADGTGGGAPAKAKPSRTVSSGNETAPAPTSRIGGLLGRLRSKFGM